MAIQPNGAPGGISVTGLGRSLTVTGSSMSSKTRSPPAVAACSWL
jgi:hypothetical protein